MDLIEARGRRRRGGQGRRRPGGRTRQNLAFDCH